MEDMSTPKQLCIKRFPFTPPHLKIPPSPFLKRLGFGTGVDVYLVERSPKQGQYRSPWAIKKISSRGSQNQSIHIKRLKNEALILSDLKHQNIVGFRSFGKTVDGSCALAMEIGEKSLMAMIEERTNAGLGPFPACSILRVASNIAEALRYLHHDKKLLHGDLKSDNVLVQGNVKSAKLCDFGVSLPMDEQLVALNGNDYIGTEPWNCNEVLRGGTVTNKADIYSFGMVLFEMLTLEIPHMHCFPEESDFDDSLKFEEMFAAADEEYRRNLGTRPPLLEYDYDVSYSPAIELFHASSGPQPSERPSALQITQCLESVVRDEEIMPNPAGKLCF